MKDEKIIAIVGIVGIIILEVTNLLTLKADGEIFMMAMAIVGGLAGYTAGHVIGKRKVNKK